MLVPFRARTCALVLAALTLASCGGGAPPAPDAASSFAAPAAVPGPGAVKTLFEDVSAALRSEDVVNSSAAMGAIYLQDGDPVAAEAWFSKGAAVQDPVSMYALARMDAYGIGTTKDPAASERLLGTLEGRRKAKAGVSDALGQRIDALQTAIDTPLASPVVAVAQQKIDATAVPTPPEARKGEGPAGHRDDMTARDGAAPDEAAATPAAPAVPPAADQKPASTAAVKPAPTTPHAADLAAAVLREGAPYPAPKPDSAAAQDLAGLHPSAPSKETAAAARDKTPVPVKLAKAAPAPAAPQAMSVAPLSAMPGHGGAAVPAAAVAAASPAAAPVAAGGDMASLAAEASKMLDQKGAVPADKAQAAAAAAAAAETAPTSAASAPQAPTAAGPVRLLIKQSPSPMDLRDAYDAVRMHDPALMAGVHPDIRSVRAEGGEAVFQLALTGVPDQRSADAICRAFGEHDCRAVADQTTFVPQAAPPAAPAPTYSSQVQPLADMPRGPVGAGLMAVLADVPSHDAGERTLNDASDMFGPYLAAYHVRLELAPDSRGGYQVLATGFSGQEDLLNFCQWLRGQGRACSSAP